MTKLTGGGSEEEDDNVMGTRNKSEMSRVKITKIIMYMITLSPCDWCSLVGNSDHFR